MNYHRGNIVLCKVPMPSVELREFKLRPCLIVSKNTNNERLDDVIIATCSSNISRSKEETQYLIEGDEITQSGIKIPSVIRCEYLLTINKSMIVKTLGALSASGLKSVEKCLVNALEISI